MILFGKTHPELDRLPKPYKMVLGEDGKWKEVWLNKPVADLVEHKIRYKVLADNLDNR